MNFAKYYITESKEMILNIKLKDINDDSSEVIDNFSNVEQSILNSQLDIVVKNDSVDVYKLPDYIDIEGQDKIVLNITIDNYNNLRDFDEIVNLIIDNIGTREEFIQGFDKEVKLDLNILDKNKVDNTVQYELAWDLK